MRARRRGFSEPGSGSQQNSQCALNGSGSTVSSSGNTLTVNLALTFLAAFTGTKNVYMDATNPFETVNWQSVGTWITAATRRCRSLRLLETRRNRRLACRFPIHWGRRT